MAIADLKQKQKQKYTSQRARSRWARPDATFYDTRICAYIFELLWTAVHAAVGQLSFGEPPPERRNVDHVQSIQNRERRRAHPHYKETQKKQNLGSQNKRGKRGDGKALHITLRSVTLGTGDATKAAVKVAAGCEVGYGPRAIESVERAEEG